MTISVPKYKIDGLKVGDIGDIIKKNDCKNCEKFKRSGSIYYCIYEKNCPKMDFGQKDETNEINEIKW